MNNLILYEGMTLLENSDMLRALPNMDYFLLALSRIVSRILDWIAGANVSWNLVRTITGEPLFMLPIGIIGLSATIGILKRMLSRD